MSVRRSSILKQTNDGTSSSFETPKVNVRRRVSFSNQRLVQHFDKTDVTIQFGTVTEEMERTGSSGSPNLTHTTSSFSQPPTVFTTPERSCARGLDATSDVFDESVGNISFVSTKSNYTPVRNTTLSVFDSFDTPRVQVLDKEDFGEDMEISFSKSVLKTPMKTDVSEQENTIVTNLSTVSTKDEVSIKNENSTVVSRVITPAVNINLNDTKLSTSRKRLANSYIYRDSPTFIPNDDGNNVACSTRNVTPFRRRSLTSSISRRSNSLRRSLIEEMSFSVEGVPTTPARENLSNTLDIDDIKDYSCSQSFINLVTPARIPRKESMKLDSPAGDIFVQDSSIVNNSMVPDKKEEIQQELDKTNVTVGGKSSCFLDESYNVVYEDVLEVSRNNSIGVISKRDSNISQNNSFTSLNKLKDLDNSMKCTSILDNCEQNLTVTDDHPSFLSAKYSESMEFKQDGSVTMNKTTSTAVCFEKSDYHEDMTSIVKNSETLTPIVEEEESQIFNKTVNIDEVVMRSEKLKDIYARGLESSEDTNMGSQGSDIFNETSGFSTDADISMWNQSDPIVYSKKDIEENNQDDKKSSNEKKEVDSQNNLSMMDVSMRTIGNSSVHTESCNIEKIVEGLCYIDPSFSIVYKENYKECDKKYQIQLALAFIQSILYNESFRHPSLKNYVVGFEKYSFLKNHMIKTEVPLDLDDLFEKVGELGNIGEIIDDFRRINLDVYTTTADQLEVFFDSLYEIYFLLLDHISIYQKKLLEENNNIGVKCSEILNELISYKKLYDEEVISTNEALNYIVSKYNL
ncbi:Hypothetical protein SRAE_1000329900 [Strongyloides ratti]|uniref:Uncharacterized protein n=1 Tax=Strongyloides ratti TaxID=34506 RepID=A0A090L5G6_STRRB|nr:Hypothetical protein SRAE_1000329900 [Strongyloides ratti]CEF65046.1 Hypothetical protein SRAE_1000329900 [Strongyloides ratti]